ncbi:MAG: hypothetical protein Kow00122_03620 [Thermoleophilia bacterium]
MQGFFDSARGGRGVLQQLGRWLSWLRGVLLVAFLAAVGFAALGCAEGVPPDATLTALGAQVGVSRLDDVDFDALLAEFTSAGYRTGTQIEQAKYQLFLTAKAAYLALGGAKSDSVQVQKQESGDKATVTFQVLRKEGIFAVADFSSITVTLARVGGDARPWLIEAITLTR